MKIAYEVTTTPQVDGKIIQEVYSRIDDTRTRLMREVMDTQEHQMRQALIALGWTPPPEPCK